LPRCPLQRGRALTSADGAGVLVLALVTWRLQRGRALTSADGPRPTACAAGAGTLQRGRALTSADGLIGRERGFAGPKASTGPRSDERGWRLRVPAHRARRLAST